MPVTRRRRANPPEQPENNNHVAEQADNNQVEAVPTEQQSQLQEQPQTETSKEAENAAPPATPVVPLPEDSVYQQMLPPATTNGERTFTRDYGQTIEGGRRTARGELFRRPPQQPVSPVPTQPAATPNSQPTLQPPSHEIKLPLGIKPGDASGDPLHLAYNPGYTGADEVRSAFLRKLAADSKHGGRARCWGCGSLAVAYECWNTRNKAFGEIGIAYCEICGVWSVM